MDTDNPITPDESTDTEPTTPDMGGDMGTGDSEESTDDQAGGAL